ncbi:hypothetical protein J6590_019620 [Homalodisca vitripennis]|nr:hypothetical protein J6590_019620 [Homalodisca vitripennis]
MKPSRLKAAPHAHTRTPAAQLCSIIEGEIHSCWQGRGGKVKHLLDECAPASAPGIARAQDCICRFAFAGVRLFKQNWSEKATSTGFS